jgi:hypothetical protein
MVVSQDCLFSTKPERHAIERDTRIGHPLGQGGRDTLGILPFQANPRNRDTANDLRSRSVDLNLYGLDRITSKINSGNCPSHRLLSVLLFITVQA